jgi:hypothetical protein
MSPIERMILIERSHIFQAIYVYDGAGEIQPTVLKIYEIGNERSQK